MIPAMSPPWWNVCGAQYRKHTLGESMPRISRRRRRRPRRSRPGAARARGGCPPARRPAAAPPSTARTSPRRSPACSGRPLSSEFIDRDAELHRDLDRALPVAHGRLPLVLVRPGPAEQRQQRGHLDARRGERLPERAHGRRVHPRMAEERDEVVARRQLDVLVARGPRRAPAARSAASSGTCTGRARCSSAPPRRRRDAPRRAIGQRYRAGFSM